MKQSETPAKKRLSVADWAALALSTAIVAIVASYFYQVLAV